MTSYTLTKDQQEACDKFMRFLLSNKKEFYLFGSAGSGKTFLSKEFAVILNQGKYKNYCKLLNLPYKYMDCIFTATTNKAAAVLAEALNIEIPTVFTHFHITVREDYLQGTTTLKNDPDFILKDSIVFIDECSMLSKKALEMIRGACGSNTKLVFIGDNNQLAPVNEKPYWNNTDPSVTAFLSTPVRNKDHQALVDLCNQLKQTVLTGKFNDIKLEPGVIDRLDPEQATEFLKNMKPNRDIVLAYTNERVDNYLSLLHTLIPDLDNARELINSQHCVPNFKPGVIQQPKPIFYPEQKIHIINAPNKRTDYPWHDQIGDKSIGYFRIQVLGEGYSSTRCKVMNAADKTALLKEFARKKQWREYIIVKNTYMVLRLPHACTIHKSQGSTYENVYIDLDSFKACKDRETLARLLYVAVSRAKNHVYFHGSLPKGFGEIYG